MPRQARIITENGCYHVITRGNQKQLVFKELSDYEMYLSIVSKYKRKYNFKLYSFCLMPNHIHLLLEVNNPYFLKKVMHGLNLSYTIYFNSKYDKVGHLWQDRFKSKIIQKDEYLAECMKYIETNPMRASLAKNITTWRWSSYVFKLENNSLIDELTI
ncbi:MAG: transposase [Candidatus Omnitrophica bacterium]|nr:transposase [Candidatus Omnitrophota bacterium]